jgi:hypothetical protein
MDNVHPITRIIEDLGDEDRIELERVAEIFSDDYIASVPGLALYVDALGERLGVVSSEIAALELDRLGLPQLDSSIEYVSMRLCGVSDDRARDLACLPPRTSRRGWRLRVSWEQTAHEDA